MAAFPDFVAASLFHNGWQGLLEPLTLPIPSFTNK